MVRLAAWPLGGGLTKRRNKRAFLTGRFEPSGSPVLDGAKPRRLPGGGE